MLRDKLSGHRTSSDEVENHLLLERNPGTIRNQDKVSQTVHDHSSIAFFYHVGEDTVDSGRQRCVTVREDIHVATFGPTDVRWGVDRFLDIGAVEVEWESLSLFKRAWEAEDVP